MAPASAFLMAAAVSPRLSPAPRLPSFIAEGCPSRPLPCPRLPKLFPNSCSLRGPLLASSGALQKGWRAPASAALPAPPSRHPPHLLRPVTARPLLSPSPSYSCFLLS